ncbi:preprotein translocase subunit SecA [Acidithiobacillus ferriphilus]|jgi:protein translocase subunit secA|uniref:preprotein translocase subunit SecA n=5 Tax=Acidithiobacillus ferriphilus TaxID=1689834 RepID=UPI001C0794A8|nr:preprotein translocase subunit SecA [Acidithiobacillus ferriphilus]MBU2846172.1 preprotein translocase subunit SecA [Acidithiobacillus ferriphilus]MEB8474284.1 preprotein translocase subunit SecA [Acidithiobacillus ferriphilus]UEP58178.1 preprotein translocase subunit SecA [Acidithiobacillus ferriphilus]
MFGTIIRHVVGSRNDRLIKKARIIVAQINLLEDRYKSMDDVTLAGQTALFKERIAQGESLDAVLPEAFAVVREVTQRVMGMRQYDVQLIGGYMLHEGKIAEMRTGEGKTLVATLPAYLNALQGKGVHVVTVNDYLASRDAQWVGKIHGFLGLSVGTIISEMSSDERRAAYAADITYGTNNEFGFDYLRDNMAFSPAERVQRGLHYAIIDEVDSILIDEARTPLIISGPTEENTDLYYRVDKLVGNFVVDEDYTVDEKARQVMLTEEGIEKAECLMAESGLLDDGNLYDLANVTLVHHLNQALRAHVIYRRETDYIVRDGEVCIVDEFTGRMMSGRRWSDGLHQAVEAKEGVAVQNENQTLASITFQNYFRMYEKLSGMTGTADTEAFELNQIYGLEVVMIPTHKPVKRTDFADLIYRTSREKWAAIVEDIRDCQQRGQPVLVGTTSIEHNEFLSHQLKQARIPHEVLNAKQHQREAEIIAQAGKPGMVTIATNMAGRGTDIVLGGNVGHQVNMVLANPDLGEEEKSQRVESLNSSWQGLHDAAIAAGGLHIIGTERHESRRVDNQLRGRSGRQGDPGTTRFYLSLDDPLMRIFGSDRLGGLMQKLGMKEGEAIEHPWVTKSIENAQRKVESRNFDIRKQLLEYDDVANEQRKIIYQQRNAFMDADDVSSEIRALRDDVLDAVLADTAPEGVMEERWDLPGLEAALERVFSLRVPVGQWLEQDKGLAYPVLRERIMAMVLSAYAAKEELLGSEMMRHFEKSIILQVLDSQWKDHLASMDHLREGIHLRGYAQKNPKQEYKKESLAMFNVMLGRLREEVISMLSRLHVSPAPAESVDWDVIARAAQPQHLQFSHPDFSAAAVVPAIENAGLTAAGLGVVGEQETGHSPVANEDKVGRNQPCPCGSGKKYKHCHGRLQ